MMSQFSSRILGRARAAIAIGAVLVAAAACDPGTTITTCTGCTASAWTAVTGSVTSSTGLAVADANIYIRIAPDRTPSAYTATSAATDDNGNFGVQISRTGTVPNLPATDTLTLSVIASFPLPGGGAKTDSTEVLVRFGPVDQQPPTRADVHLHIDP